MRDPITRTTLWELVDALQRRTPSDAAVVCAVVALIRSGRLRPAGAFVGAHPH